MLKPPSPVQVVVNESGLEQFRAASLSPSAILQHITPNAPTLIKIPVGVGKSTLVDHLIASPDVWERYQRIVYFAPTHAILQERLRNPALQKYSWVEVKARPTRNCGPLDARITDLEQRGCAVFAKRMLCPSCPHFATCHWPHGQKEALSEARIVFSTEQRIVVNPSFLRNVSGDSTLVILDEAKSLDLSQKSIVLQVDLTRFQGTVEQASIPDTVKEQWRYSLDVLAHCDTSGLQDPGWRFPPLNQHTFEIQQTGLSLFPSDFQNLAYTLAAFPFSTPETRWKDVSGNINFVTPKHSNSHLLLLSAHLNADYAAHRLNVPKVRSPFEDITIRHSQTRIYNIKSGLGAARYFMKNSPQILDFFATLILRNILQNRSTLLVSKQYFKKQCAEYLQARLAEWGMAVTFPFPGEEAISADLAVPTPTVIPIIHYGVIGINDFTDYESCYCLNSYYVSPQILNQTLQEREPGKYQVKLQIVTDASSNRQVEIPDPLHQFSGLDTWGNHYLQKAEVDPIIQAAGRVRFHTNPREIIFFALHDLKTVLGDVAEIKTLEEARQAFQLPPAKHITRWIQKERLEALRAQGHTLTNAAKQLGITRETARSRLKTECPDSPLSLYKYKGDFWHLTLHDGLTEGGQHG